MFRSLNKLLEGKPDGFIAWLLIALSVFGLLVALYGTPTLRLFLAGYYLFP